MERMSFCNRKNFERAVELLKIKAPRNEFEIEETYLDYGAGLKWETIIAYRNSERGTNRDSYQMLCPRDWKELDEIKTDFDIKLFVNKLILNQSSLLRF